MLAWVDLKRNKTYLIRIQWIRIVFILLELGTLFWSQNFEVFIGKVVPVIFAKN